MTLRGILALALIAPAAGACVDRASLPPLPSIEGARSMLLAEVQPGAGCSRFQVEAHDLPWPNPRGVAVADGLQRFAIVYTGTLEEVGLHPDSAHSLACTESPRAGQRLEALPTPHAAFEADFEGGAWRALGAAMPPELSSFLVPGPSACPTLAATKVPLRVAPGDGVAALVQIDGERLLATTTEGYVYVVDGQAVQEIERFSPHVMTAVRGPRGRVWLGTSNGCLSRLSTGTPPLRAIEVACCQDPGSLVTALDAAPHNAPEAPDEVFGLVGPKIVGTRFVDLRLARFDPNARTCELLSDRYSTDLEGSTVAWVAPGEAVMLIAGSSTIARWRRSTGITRETLDPAPARINRPIGALARIESDVIAGASSGTSRRAFYRHDGEAGLWRAFLDGFVTHADIEGLASWPGGFLYLLDEGVAATAFLDDRERCEARTLGAGDLVPLVSIGPRKVVAGSEHEPTLFEITAAE